MTETEAKQKQLEIYAMVGQRMCEENNEDYVDWLNEEELVTACEVEKNLYGNEFCLCGKHEQIEDNL